MRREDFEHVVAAAAEIVDVDELVVIGSQAILGSHPDAPDSMLRSMEVDVYPLHEPDKSIEIDSAIGDGSPFARTYGYFAHGVGPETAKAPAAWEGRLVRVVVTQRVGLGRTPVALCLEPHDLVLAKCAAGRDRDWDFARQALRAGMVRADELDRRAATLPVEQPQIDHIRAMLVGIVKSLSCPP